MGKVIDMFSGNKVVSINKKTKADRSQNTNIIDFHEKRSQILEADRREKQRTILTEFVSAYVVIPQRGLMKVDIYDIADSGMAFDVEGQHGKFRSGEMLSMRIYLNHKTYFSFDIEVKHVSAPTDEGTFRHGAAFVNSKQNNVALSHFVKFIEAVSQDLKEDLGDMLAPNIS